MKHIGYILASFFLFTAFAPTFASAKVMSKYDHSNLLKAIEDYRFNDTEAATKSLEKLHQRFPKNLRVLHYLGLTYQESMQYKKAIDIFNLWINGSKDKTSEKSRFAWMGIARSHIGLKNHWEAIRSIKRWLKKNKSDIQSQIMLGDVLIRAEAFNQAKRVWHAILNNKRARRSQHAAAWYYKAWMAFLIGETTRMKGFVLKSLALDSEGSYADPARNLLTTPPPKKLGFMSSASAESFYNSNVVLQPDTLQSVTRASDIGVQANLMLGWSWRKVDINYLFSTTVHQDYSDFDVMTHSLSSTWTGKQWSFTPSYENISLNGALLYQGAGLTTHYSNKGWTYHYTGKVKRFTQTFGNTQPVNLSRLGGSSHVLGVQKGLKIRGINTLFSSEATSELTDGDATHNQTDSYLQISGSVMAIVPISATLNFNGTLTIYSRQYSAADTDALSNPATNIIRNDLSTQISTSTTWKPWSENESKVALNIAYTNNSSNYASGVVPDELSKSYSSWNTGLLISTQW